MEIRRTGRRCFGIVRRSCRALYCSRSRAIFHWGWRSRRERFARGYGLVYIECANPAKTRFWIGRRIFQASRQATRSKCGNRQPVRLNFGRAGRFPAPSCKSIYRSGAGSSNRILPRRGICRHAIQTHECSRQCQAAHASPCGDQTSLAGRRGRHLIRL